MSLSDIEFLDGYFLDCDKIGQGVSSSECARMKRLMNDHIITGGLHGDIIDVISSDVSMGILARLIQSPKP